MGKARLSRAFLADPPEAISKARAARYLLELADCARHLFELDVWFHPKPSQHRTLLEDIRRIAHQALVEALDELEMGAGFTTSEPGPEAGKAVA